MTTWLRLFGARWFAFWHKAQFEAEIDEEVRFHIAMRAQENIERGAAPQAALASAQRQFGNVNSIKDAWRDVSGGGALEVLRQDVRFAVRMFRKDRAFAAVAVLALALSIGANTALFTIASRVLLRPLSYPEPERLMAISSRDTKEEGSQYTVSFPDFLDLEARNHWFEQIAAFNTGTFVAATATGTNHLKGAHVTSEMFSLLRVRPLLGRDFTSADDQPGSRVVIVSYDLWREHFGSATDLSRATLSLDGLAHRIVGVMPFGFGFPVQNDSPRFWTTFARDHEPIAAGGFAIGEHRDGHYLHVLGRLKPDVSRAEAEAGFAAIARALALKYPETNGRFDSYSITLWLADITKSVRPVLLLLSGAALCVLALACANVANLLLARGTTRQREMAVRSALGAGRSRILRQLLTESLLLAVLGGILGLLIAYFATRCIVPLLPLDFPRVHEIAPDLRTLWFTVLMTLATTCLFGVAPAWRSARSNLAPLLNDSSGDSTENSRGRRLRSVLVIVEMILAFVLLFAATLCLGTLWRLQNVAPGFNPRGVLTAKVALPDRGDPDATTRSAYFYEELVSRIGRIPGVQSASACYSLPLDGVAGVANVEIVGRPMPKAELPRARANSIAADYFRTMEIPVVKGREFGRRDDRSAPGVAVVNETLARTFFGNEDPVGKRIRPGISDSYGIPMEREIIGVVANIKSDNPATDEMAVVYLPHSQCVQPEMTLVMRSAHASGELLSSLRRTIDGMQNGLPLYEPRRMEDYVSSSIAQPRLNAIVLVAFTVVAVSLTGIGVYGVMEYTVAQRRHELGIRLAVGAPSRAVFRLIMGEGVRLVGVSITAGILGSWVLVRSVQPRYFGGTINLPMLLLVSGLLSIVALAACWIPARRAVRLDPLAAIGRRQPSAWTRLSATDR